MMELDGLNILNIPYAIPLVVIISSLFLGAFLGVSYWVMLILCSLPFLVLNLDLPLVSEIKQAGYLWVFLGSYALIFCFLFGRRLTRGLGTGLSIITFLFHLTLWCSAGVVGVLYLYPNLLDTYASNWQQHAGLLLFGVALLGAAVSAISFLRASAIVVFWLFISLSLGSEIFLGKLPQEIFPSQIRKMTFNIADASDLSGMTVALIDQAKQRGKKIILALGGAATAGEPFDTNDAYPAQVEKQLAKRLGTGEISVVNLATTATNGENLLSVLRSALENIRPNIVTLEASAETDLGGLEPPPLEIREDESLVNRILNGRVFNLVKYLFSNESSLSSDSAERANIGFSFDNTLIIEAMKIVKNAGAKAVLILRPTNRSDRLNNNNFAKEALARTSKENGGYFIDVEPILDSEQYVQLFVAKDLLTRAGHKLQAKEIAEKLLPLLGY